MRKQISKDTLEHYLTAVESAVRDSFPVNSCVVSSLNEIMRLALKGYELETAGLSTGEGNISLERQPVPQLGIR